jgi:cytoskeletal protein RodZ
MSAAIGKILQATREDRGLTIEQVAETTHIRKHFIQALEAGDFDALPSRLQVKGFLRSYAGLLGLDESALLDMLEHGVPGDITPADLTPPPPEALPPIDLPAARFIEVGQTLKAQRELLGLSLDDVERHTHLRKRYLKALEAGDLDGLPSPVQGRGMLKNYADFLGLDPDPLLMTFADGLQAGLSERRADISETASAPATYTAPVSVPASIPKAASSPTRPKRRLFNRDIFIGAFIVIFLLAFGVWGGLQIASLRDAEQETVPTPPSIAEVLLPSPTVTQQPTPTTTVLAAIDEEAIITPGQSNSDETQSIAVTPIGPIGPVRVQIVVRERAYMRIIVDGETEFDGRVIAGSVYAFAGEELVEIVTGSGSALQVMHNEQEIGVLGTYGEAVNFVITIDGIQTPTPTITLTPTETPTPLVTPTPNP